MFNLVFTEKINHIKDFKWSNRLLIVRVLDFFFYTLSLPPRCKYFDSTGRNEIIVLDNLLKYEKSSKSSPAK